MKKLFFALLGALMIAPAFSATAPLSFAWDRPTTYVDGSTLPAASITGYQMVCEVTNPAGAPISCDLSVSALTGSSVTATGTLTYPATGATACFRLRTQTASAISDPSPLGPNSCVTFAPVKPSPPGNVTVTITVALNIDVNGATLASNVETYRLTEIAPR